MLFFYVCWPYSARPAQVWKNWRPRAPNEAHEIIVEQDAPSLKGLHRNKLVHASDDGAFDASQSYVGPLTVVAVEKNQLTLAPAEGFAPESSRNSALRRPVVRGRSPKRRRTSGPRTMPIRWPPRKSSRRKACS
jgi:hypothetical protein